MLPTDWTTDPALREFFGEVSRATSDAGPREGDATARELRDTGGATDDPISRLLKGLFHHLVESFAAYGCAMSPEYYDPAALFAPRRTTPAPARRPRLRSRCERLRSFWQVRRSLTRVTRSLDTLDDRMLRDIGLRRDQIHDREGLRLQRR